MAKESEIIKKINELFSERDKEIKSLKDKVSKLEKDNRELTSSLNKSNKVNQINTKRIIELRGSLGRLTSDIYDIKREISQITNTIKSLRT
jgi:chromosome segregation ATPase